MTTPIQATCDHCQQKRPLFLYKPAPIHIHGASSGFTCQWCVRDRQPLLCSRCWSAEKSSEEATLGEAMR